MFTRTNLTVAITVVAFAAVSATTSEQRSNILAIPIIKHSLLLKADNSVDFDTLDAHVEYAVAKTACGLDNYERNTGTSHPAAAKYGATPGKRGVSFPLSTHKKVFWYGSLTIGTPPKSFSVVFDTGSADFFVPAVACYATCKGHSLWDPQSKTARPVEGGCKLQYADKSIVQGDKYTDNVTIAGFTAQTQTICAATSYSPQFSIDIFPPDGALGMAFPSISFYGANPVFETLVSEGAVVDRVFSFNLSATGGELYIGGANRKLYKDDLVYTPVTNQGYWQVKVGSIQGMGKTILTNIDAIIDTGTTFIIGDPLRVSRLHRTLGGKYYLKGFYTYPCDAFPEVRLTFKGKSFPISASTHNVGLVGTASPNYCFSGIVGRNSASKFWSIGGVFLQNVYTTFDYGDTKRVGFAEHA